MTETTEVETTGETVEEIEEDPANKMVEMITMGIETTTLIDRTVPSIDKKTITTKQATVNLATRDTKTIKISTDQERGLVPQAEEDSIKVTREAKKVVAGSTKWS